jgi:hypothetical protein
MAALDVAKHRRGEVRPRAGFRYAVICLSRTV